MTDSAYTFEELIDIEALEQISANIHAIAGIPIRLVDLTGKVQIEHGWERVCIEFHQANPITHRTCIRADDYLRAHLDEGPYTVYQCSNGLIDIASSITINGQPIATLYIGQFFYEDEPFQEDFFINQAKTYDFNVNVYLAALSEVPRYSRTLIVNVINFYKALISSMADYGILRLELNATLRETTFKEARLNALFSAIDDLIFVNDSNYCYTEYVTSNKEDLYVPVEEFIGKHIDQVLPPHLSLALKRCFRKLDAGETPEPVEYSLDINGEECWFSAKVTSITDFGRSGYNYLTVVRDITDVKRNEHLIRKLAYYDELTGLYNRTMFYELLHNAIEESKRDKSQFAVVFMDLDNFKKVNDTRGHHIGDILLKNIADRLRSNLRESDVIARIGGDEFTLLIHQVSFNEDFLDFIMRLIATVNEPVVIDDLPEYISPSLGISLYPGDGHTAETLVRNADAAMYQAKEKGKNRYQIYNQEIHELIASRYQMENDLRKALADNEFQVYYQPIVDPSDKSIHAFEALLRWKRQGDYISPETFIPLAEDMGLIIPIGYRVFKQACTFCKELQDQYGQNRIVSVNTSTVQLKNPKFIEEIKVILDETGVEASLMEIEITESNIIEEFDAMVVVLKKIKDLGIRVALDDFGTGYSSLSYIKTLPLDTVKIDRMFIRDICHNTVDRYILEVISSLAHKLNFIVVSEGVEDSNQVKLLSNGMTDFIQGYYYYKSMPREEVLLILTEKNTSH